MVHVTFFGFKKGDGNLTDGARIPHQLEKDRRSQSSRPLLEPYIGRYLSQNFFAHPEKSEDFRSGRAKVGGVIRVQGGLSGAEVSYSFAAAF